MSDRKIDVSLRYNDGDYLSKNHTWHIEDSPWKASKIHKIISQNNINPKTICEIGCGAGEILKQLSNMDAFSTTKFSGYEVSSDAFNLCKDRETERVKFYLKDLLVEDVYFDIALCIDVFEHVEDYMGFIRNFKSKAEYKIFHVPLDLSISSLLRNRLLKGRESIGHLHYFTPDTALETIKDCNYEIIDVAYTPWFLDLPSQTLKAKISKLPRLLIYKYSPKLLSTLFGGCSLLVLAK